MKTAKLSEQSLKLIETLCDYTDKPDILNAVQTLCTTIRTS